LPLSQCHQQAVLHVEVLQVLQLVLHHVIHLLQQTHLILGPTLQA